MHAQVIFRHRTLPYLLVLPQLVVTFIFFLYPAGQALYQSLLREDAWGTRREFVWFENFADIFDDNTYLHSLGTTFFFAIAVTFLSMALALLLAVMADRVVRGGNLVRAFLIWPYAIAPAVAGAVWVFLFNPAYGIVAYGLRDAGVGWNHRVDGNQALMLVILAAAWKQISYNFLFFLAGLQAIPKSVIEAAAIDGARFWKRFWTIVFPLLSPTTFFLLVVNVVYAFFETFGVIHTITAGGPRQDTTILVYKVYADGFVGQDLGSSAAQSVILLVVVGALTIVQFRYIERRVHY